MILKFNKGCTQKQVEAIVSKLIIDNIEHYITSWKGSKIIVCNSDIFNLPDYVESEVIDAPYKLASKEFQNEKTIIDIDGIKLGGKKIIMIAGPCAVEDRENLIETAHFVKSAGGQILRGGAFKPRTSPYSFRGLK